MKDLSDEKIPITLVLVGIADSDTDLLTSPEYPQYKGRHFLAFRIPRMSRTELADIVNKREQLFHIKFAAEETQKISEIAAGYPQYAHTLALYASTNWLVENFAAVIASWADKFPLVGLFVKPFIKRVTVKSINWNITAKNLNHAVTRLTEQFEASDPDTARAVKNALGSEHRESVRALLGLLARSEADDVGADEIVKVLGLTRQGLDDLIRDHMEDVVDHHLDRYRLRIPQLRPYSLSLEYQASIGSGIPRAGAPAAP